MLPFSWSAKVRKVFSFFLACHSIILFLFQFQHLPVANKIHFYGSSPFKIESIFNFMCIVSSVIGTKHRTQKWVEKMHISAMGPMFISMLLNEIKIEIKRRLKPSMIIVHKLCNFMVSYQQRTHTIFTTTLWYIFPCNKGEFYGWMRPIESKNW